MESRFYKFVYTLLCFIFISGVSYADSYDDAILTIQQNLINSEKSVEKIKYSNDLKRTYIRRYNFYRKNENWNEASKSLFCVLFFSKGHQYDFYKKKLDYTLEKAELNKNDANSLFEIAWALTNSGQIYGAKYILSQVEPSLVDEWRYFELLGDIESIEENYKNAVDAYTKSLKLRNNNKFLSFKLAVVYDKMGLSGLSIEEFRKVLDSKDEKTAQEIVNIFNKKLETNPSNQNYYEILGTAYLVLNQQEKTLELYTKALEIKPDDIFLRYTIANFLHLVGKNSEAVSMYDSILNYDIYELQIRAGKAKCLEKLGRIKEALKEYQTILLFYPDSPQAKFGIYEILKDKKDSEEILKSFYPLNSNFKPNAEFISTFADNLLLVDDKNGAEKFYLLALAKDNKNRNTLVKLYNFYELTQKEKTAKNVIEKAYELYPNDLEIIKKISGLNKAANDKKNDLALEYIAKKQYKQAIEIYKQVDPKDDNTYFSIANCYLMLDDNKNSILYLEKSLSINPKNIDAAYNLAVLNYKNGNLDASRKILDKLSADNLQNANTQLLLSTVKQKQVDEILNSAYSYYENKKYKKADEILSTGLKKFPKEAQLYYYKGVNKEASGDILGAIQEYRLAVKYDKMCSIAYYSLANLLEAVDNKKGALEAYEIFLSHNIDDKERNTKARERVEVLSKECY